VPITFKRNDLFPDDTNPLPTSGSVEQQRLLADELEVGNEAYLQSLQKISSVANDLYPELIGGCINVLAEVQLARPLRVMNLCSGVGLAALKLLEQDVAVEELVLVDVSPQLLERAVELLGRSAHFHKVKKLGTTQLDPLIDDLTRWTAGAFDLVVTVNAFAHFPRERQRQLFTSIHRLLSPGGVFMFASQFKPLRPKWKDSVIRDIQDSLRNHGATEETVANAGIHVASFHNHLNVADVYNWLESAGFSFFECVFRRSILGIFAAVK
jgi:tRNA (cmo5U34)-methyltransferase